VRFVDAHLLDRQPVLEQAAKTRPLQQGLGAPGTSIGHDPPSTPASRRRVSAPLASGQGIYVRPGTSPRSEGPFGAAG